MDRLTQLQDAIDAVIYCGFCLECNDLSLFAIDGKNVYKQYILCTRKVRHGRVE